LDREGLLRGGEKGLRMEGGLRREVGRWCASFGIGKQALCREEGKLV